MNFTDPRKQLDDISDAHDADGDGIRDEHEMPVKGDDRPISEIAKPKEPFLKRAVKLGRKVLAGEKWKALSILKNFIKPFIPSWIGKVADGVGDSFKTKNKTMANAKGLTKSKTIITAILLGIAGVLALFGIIPEEMISPDAGWVATATAVAMFVLRLVTKEPVQLGGQ